MIFQRIKEEFGFEQQGNYMVVATDFENISINCDNPKRYFINEKNLIRFINEELLEEYPCDEEIHGVYFLPTHKTDDFFDSLDNEKILPELKYYYTEEMLFTYGEASTNLQGELTIKHKDRARYGTSFYGADAASLDELIRAGQQILKLNSMRDYKIAAGSIDDNMGLLERSSSDKATTPKSRHYNFWKFDKCLTGMGFFDIAKRFNIIKEKKEVHK